MYLLLAKVTAQSAPEIESFGGNEKDVTPLERRMSSSSCGDCSGYDKVIASYEETIELSMDGLTETGREILKLSEMKEYFGPSNKNDPKYYELACRVIEKEQKKLREWSKLNYITHNRKRFAEKQKAWCERKKAKCERKAAKAARKASKNWTTYGDAS